MATCQDPIQKCNIIEPCLNYVEQAVLSCLQKYRPCLRDMFTFSASAETLFENYLKFYT